LPVPTSATAATTCPCLAIARSSARDICCNSFSRPTNSDDRARPLRVEFLHQRGRAFDVREQRRHGLALTIDCFRSLVLARDANARLNRYGWVRSYLWLGSREAIAAFAAKL
jgi:hypothetical protein